MDSGAAFVGYKEGPVLFRPTYRYDLGTDNYDTSEKMRVPAWTGMLVESISSFIHGFIFLDRILFRGPQLDLAAYSRAELRSSDHKPGAQIPHLFSTYLIAVVQFTLSSGQV